MSGSPSRSSSLDGQQGSPSTGEPARFERVDWEQIDQERRRLTSERIALLVGIVAIVALYLAHWRSGSAILVLRWNVGWEDWLLMIAIVVIFAYGVLPLVQKPTRASRYLHQLGRRPGTVLAMIVFMGVVLVGSWAILSGYRALIPWEVSIDPLQPPVGTTTVLGPTEDCLGPVNEVDGSALCQGTWTYPLGTDTSGYPIAELVIMGTRPVVYATIVTIGMVVPVATIVGTVAGYYGGIIDDLLMAYVDIQLSFPAILIYLVMFMFVLNSMAVFLLAFGLLSWGGIARIVRSETLQRREEGYVMTARAIGAPGPYILRRHLVPNVTNSAIPAAFHLIAIIVITEAGLSFLGFNPIEQSWGDTIRRSFIRAHPIAHWWIGAFPALALAVTILSCKALGDGLRDIFDPRGEQ